MEIDDGAQMSACIKQEKPFGKTELSCTCICMHPSIHEGVVVDLVKLLLFFKDE